VLDYDTERIQLVRGDVTMEILLDGALQASLLNSSTYVDDYYLRGLSIRGYDSLSYTIALTPYVPGDANHDGKVDDADAQGLAANWSPGSAESTPVPEPGPNAMLLLAAVLLHGRGLVDMRQGKGKGRWAARSD